MHNLNTAAGLSISLRILNVLANADEETTLKDAFDTVAIDEREYARNAVTLNEIECVIWAVFAELFSSTVEIKRLPENIDNTLFVRISEKLTEEQALITMLAVYSYYYEQVTQTETFTGHTLFEKLNVVSFIPVRVDHLREWEATVMQLKAVGVPNNTKGRLHDMHLQLNSYWRK